jgi:chaperonin GroEL
MQLLLVDKKIQNAKEVFKILDNAVKEMYPIVIVAEDVDQEALAPIIRNKLKGLLKGAAIKAPAFGERKSHYLDDIAILTGGRRLSSTVFFSFFPILCASILAVIYCIVK